MSTDTTIVGVASQTVATDTLQERGLALMGRKFLFALAVLISLSVLRWFSKIDDGVYSVGLVTLIGSFFASNVMQKKIPPITTTS